MNNKHKAVITVLVLIIVFMGLALWYMATHPARPETPLFPSPAAPTAPETQVVSDSGPYHEARVTYPGSTPLMQGNDAAIAVMRAFAEREVARLAGYTKDLNAEEITMQRLDEGRKYSLQGDYTVHRGMHTVSYVYTLSEDTLGAHPNTTPRTFTFDLATGKQLTLSDLFAGNYLSVLSERSRADLPGSISRQSDSEANLEYIASGTAPTEENFQHWYIEDKNFIIVFPPYQVGPYVLGTVTELIPLSELSILKAQYR